MSAKKGHIVVSILCALLAFAYLYSFETIVFDDSYDALINNISSGQFSSFPLMDQHYLGVILIRDFLKAVQEIFPQINVFSSFYVLLNVISLAVYVYLIISYFLKTTPFSIKLVFSFAIVLLFLENILSITHTRFATVLCGVALYQLLSNKSLHQYLWAAVFVFGFLIRPESGIGALLIIGIGALLFEKNKLKPLLKWKYPILCVIVFTSVFYIHQSFTSRFEILIEPDIEYALSTGRVVPLSEMQNKEDSLKYLMSINGMFIDEGFTDISFLKSITKKQFAFDFEKFIDSLYTVAQFYTYYLFFMVFYISSLVLSRPRNRWRLLLYYGAIYIILSYLDYNVSIADRHFVSLQLIALIYPIYISFKHLNKYWITISLSIVLLSSALYTCSKAINNQRLVAQDVTCIETAMQEFEEVFASREVLLGISSYHLVDRKYSFYTDNYSSNDYLLYDAMCYSVVPRNISYLSSLCSCDADNAVQLISWVSETDGIILMDNERAALLQAYLDLKTNYKLQLEIDPAGASLQKPNCLQNLAVNDYFPWIVVSK